MTKCRRRFKNARPPRLQRADTATVTCGAAKLSAPTANQNLSAGSTIKSRRISKSSGGVRRLLSTAEKKPPLTAKKSVATTKPCMSGFCRRTF